MPYNAPHAKGTEGEGFVVTTPSDMVLWMKAQMGQLELPENLANAIAAVFESSYYCGIAFSTGSIFLLFNKKYLRLFPPL